MTIDFTFLSGPPDLTIALSISGEDGARIASRTQLGRSPTFGRMYSPSPESQQVCVVVQTRFRPSGRNGYAKTEAFKMVGHRRDGPLDVAGAGYGYIPVSMG